jgi:hypothetical protein
VAHAKQPNIVSGQRRSTLRIREIVIKVKVIGCATQYASTLVAFVHLTLNRGGNHTIVDEIRGWPVPSYEFNFIVSKEKSEFEYFAATTPLSPGIDKLEYAVVCPNPIFDFLVDSDCLGLAAARLEFQRCFLKLAVRCQFSGRSQSGLI